MTMDADRPQPSDEPPPDPEPGSGSGPARRSHTVLYSSIGVAVVLTVLVAVLAFAKPSKNVAGQMVGKAAPPVSGPAINGTGSYSLAQFAGKWVLVNFSASWCVPCRQETPQLVDFEADHTGPKTPNNAAILAIGFDPPDLTNLARFLEQSHATWPAINDPTAEVAYGVSELPQSFLVDPLGRVVAQYSGPVTAAQLNGFIDKATSTQ